MNTSPVDILSRIGLGTAQFGMIYGISNKEGQTPPEEVADILNLAKSKFINLIDTASSYGNSEKVLGYNNLNGFQVVSKFMPPQNKISISSQINSSLNLLKVPSLYGYLAHRPLELISDESQWVELNRIKNAGLVQKIGFSFYKPEEIDLILEKGWKPDIVQVPFNYFDRRFTQRLILLKNAGCEIHTRSTFLQGLFFMDPVHLSSFFDPVKPLIRQLHQYGDQLPNLLLKYCLSQNFIDYVIIGVNNKKQLELNLSVLDTKDSLPEINNDIPEKILIPSKWEI